MNRPRARAGRTPISSRVRIVEPAAEVGVGGGDPCRIAGGGAGGDDESARIEVVSGPFDATAGRGSTATPPEAALAAPGAAAGAPTGDVLRCGSFAICASTSFTVWGRSPGSLASTFVSSASSSSGSLGLIFTADGIGALTVAYATSMRFEPT